MRERRDGENGRKEIGRKSKGSERREEGKQKRNGEMIKLKGPRHRVERGREGREDGGER